jgi:CheY-specific phosphatase CheX
LDAPDQRLAPFLEATATTLQELAGVEVFPGETGPGSGLDPAETAVALPLLAGTPGWVVLSVPPTTAGAVARRVLTGVDGDPDEVMIRDCLAEVLNVLAGQTKSLVFGTDRHFDLGLPTAPPVGIFDGSAEWRVVRFESEVGPFTLHVRPPFAAGPES